jgi:hypothetical protein
LRAKLIPDGTSKDFQIQEDSPFFNGIDAQNLITIDVVVFSWIILCKKIPFCLEFFWW